jgi:hypothetical protein
MKRKNATKKMAPIARKTAKSALLLPACRIPNTTQNMPTPDNTAPMASKGRVGSGASGSTMRRLRRTMVATTAA